MIADAAEPAAVLGADAADGGDVDVVAGGEHVDVLDLARLGACWSRKLASAWPTIRPVGGRARQSSHGSTGGGAFGSASAGGGAPAAAAGGRR